MLPIPDKHVKNWKNTKFAALFRSLTDCICHLCDFVSRKGSIIQDVDLSFSSSSVPSNTQIAELLRTAAAAITEFTIDTNSIEVDGIGKQIPRPDRHNMYHVITYCCFDAIIRGLKSPKIPRLKTFSVIF